MKEKSIEVKVGALVLVCAALLIGFIFVLGDIGGSSGFQLPIDYNTASDVKPGAPVKIAGVSSGKVTGVEYWGGKLDPKAGRRVTVRVLVDIDPEKGKTLRQDAQFFISTQGLLGEKYIEVDPGSYDKPLLVAGTPVVGVPPLRMEVLGQQLTKVSGALTRLLEKNEGVINDLLVHSDQTVLDAKKAINDADKLIVDNQETVKRVIDRLDKTGDKIDKLVAVMESAIGDGSKIKKSLTNVERITAKADNAIDPILADTRAATKNLRGLTEKLRDRPTAEVLLGDKGHGKVMGMLDRVDGAVQKADKAVDDVQAVTENARKGKGTVGGLLMDNELFMDLKLLLKDLKRHPWKFIWRE
ncbi:MAG: MCE family protein [Deltaproteobacteria bacterium]|nr:MCE family protein [Deltaproteobacteria bacterium]